MTTSLEVFELLLQRYRQPDYALISEVRDGTGFSAAGREMDAMAFSMWPSRGLEIIGFEIKVNRNDWLRELKHPEKAETFFKYLDRWYVVAAEDVVFPYELPKGWGLLEVRNGKLRRVVEATLKKAKPIDRLLLMSIVRNFDKKTVPMAVVDRRVESQVEIVRNRITIERQNEIDHAHHEYNQLKNKVDDFERASGIQIADQWRYTAAEVGAVVKAVLSAGPEYIRKRMEYAVRELRGSADLIEKAISRTEAVINGTQGE